MFLDFEEIKNEMLGDDFNNLEEFIMALNSLEDEEYEKAAKSIGVEKQDFVNFVSLITRVLNVDNLVEEINSFNRILAAVEREKKN